MKWRILAALLAMTSHQVMAEEIEGEPPIPEIHALSMNVGIVSQYVYRGIAQTNGNPAIQGGIDYVYKGSFYVGTWLSNSSYYSDLMTGASSSLEVDGYAGYKGKFADDWSYDVGFLHYDYPGTYPAASLAAAKLVNPNSNEIYGALGYKWATVKYSRSTGALFGIPGSSGTYYLEANGDIPLWETGLTLSLHAGRQSFQGMTVDGVTNASLFSYTDYRIGVSKDISKYIVSLAATTTNANALGYTNLYGRNMGAAHVVASVYREF
ncbi:MAG: TorF family putative porin [Burkholderiales bacterium]